MVNLAFSAFFPIVDFAIWNTIYYIKKSKDQGWKIIPQNFPVKTKCKSISEYCELYGGVRYDGFWVNASII